MARDRRRAEFLFDGLLVVDKPAGLTSAEVVERVKKVTRPKRIGHTGTLDPFATGVLILCFNQATKLAGYLIDQDKVYEGVMRLGVTTDTYDLTGQIRRKEPVRVGEDEIIAAAQRFKGVIEQKPPAFSALKQDGEALYKKARRGEEVSTEPREVTIHRLDVLEIDPPRVHFEVHCSKGTYIRTLAHDWGRALGCGGVLEELRRLAAEPFTIDQALNLGLVESLARQRRLKGRLISPAKALPHWPAAVLDDDTVRKISHGQALTGEELAGLAPEHHIKGQRLRIMNRSGELVALAQLAAAADGSGLTARPIRVLQVNS